MENTNPQVNIIDLILQKGAETFEQSEPKDTKVINADNFFTNNNPGGFMSKAGFLALMYSMNKSELNAFKAFLSELNNNASITANTYESYDEDDRSHVWASISQKRGRRNFKIYTAEKLCLFIGMYQCDMFTCDLSLNSLYQEANR